MRPEFFGDRYDFIKREFIHGLAHGHGWAVHPMYFARPLRFNFASQYARFLGVRVVEGRIYDKNLVIDVGSHCPNHLFLDPDTGLPTLQNANRINLRNARNNNVDLWQEYVAMGELAAIVAAPGREDRLTLVYDQSNPYLRTVRQGRELAQGKLNVLVQRGVFGAAYVTSQAFFIWVSANQDTVFAATHRLKRESGLPIHRFVGEGI